MKWKVFKNYTPFFKYLKEKHGVSVIYEILYQLPPLPVSETVEAELP